MAFQGIKNQGPDPLQMFLAVNQLRRQQEADEQKLALERVKAAQDAAKFAQGQQKAQLDQQKAVFELEGLIRDREQGLATTAQNFNDESRPLPERQASADQFVRDLEGSIARRTSLGQDVDSAALDAGGNVATGTAQISDDARQDELAAERTFRFSERTARSSENRMARRAARQVSAMTGEIFKLEDEIEKMPFGSKKRIRAQRELRAMEARLLRITDEGLPEAVAEAKKFLSQDVALSQQIDRTVLDLEQIRQYVADQGPDFLGGIQGGGQELFGRFTETLEDIGALFGAEFAEDVEREIGLLTPAQARQMQKDLGISDDGTLQRRADIKQLSSRIAYIITRNQNPGRFSNEQYRDTLKRIRFDTGTAKQAFRNLTTALDELRAAGIDTKNRVLLYNRSLGIGPSGGLVDPSGEVVLPGAQATGFSGFSSDPAAAQRAAEANRSNPGTGGFSELPPDEKSSRVEDALRRRGLRQ